MTIKNAEVTVSIMSLSTMKFFGSRLILLQREIAQVKHLRVESVRKVTFLKAHGIKAKFIFARQNKV